MQAVADLIDRRAVPVVAADGVTVAVVITTYNHAHFLDDALASVTAQTRPADDVLVVDDGSTDDPAAVVGRYPGVRFIRKDNAGLAAARNTGWRNCATSHVVFLDADDRLLPHALECGVRFWTANPECALIYGGHRYVSPTLKPLGADIFFDVGDDPHHDLMLRNAIGMHATVLYQRRCLEEIGGFEETLRRCEDHDMYLRMAQKYPMAGYPITVAEYRRHAAGMTADKDTMLRSVLSILDRHEARLPHGSSSREVLREGRARWRALYAREVLGDARAQWRESGRFGPLARSLAKAVAWSPPAASRAMASEAVRTVRGMLPSFGRRRRTTAPATPGGWGYERGMPVDRYYIEAFLAAHAGDIRGRVLEVGDNHYTLRFGGPDVTHSDVIHVNDTNPLATIVGDLADPACLPDETFDCIVLTQTLHLLFDMRAGVAALYRALKPGGILLITTPGITPVGRQDDWQHTWFWSLTDVSMRRLLEERFTPKALEVNSHGNQEVAIAFLRQLTCEEAVGLSLDDFDPCYPIVITARARKGS